jgi:predicted ATPase/class 3 adenylate cyclase
MIAPEDCAMPTPPTGTVTFLFTDIEGSTRRWDEQPDAMQQALRRHDAILREAIEAHDGHVFKTMGDAFHAAFARATDAAAAAVASQRALTIEPWGEACPGDVRMALHTGTADERDGDYFGPSLNRVARLLEVSHGGQILFSAATQELLRGPMPEGVELRDLGVHRLRDLAEPEQVYQAAISDLPADFPPLRTEQSRTTNLPASLTSFVGRERELDEVARLLETARLVTLTGPGGTGKTRLAIAVAHRVRDAFPDGVWFVDLAPVGEIALVTSAIAQALGVRQRQGQTLADSLVAYLRERRLLMLLDNFEQVVEAAPLVRDLLVACAGIEVLVTSRVVLRLTSEHEYPVPPLPVPDIGALDTALPTIPSVALFVDRARQARPDFVLTVGNAGAVAEVCARLDGLPLAIELAAARIRLLSPEDIRTRLERRLTLLIGGARDLPARQRTLRDAIAWSYDLLRPAERRLFRWLAVFAGGWTMEAAEAVCAAEGAQDTDVLDGLDALVTSSLIQRRNGRDGGSRLTMLETIREFALDRLVIAGEHRDLQQRHATFFLDLVESVEPHLRGADQVAWLDLLEVEHDNVRAALTWALAEGERGLTLRSCAALWWFWNMRGHWTEGCRWLALALEQPGAETGPRYAEALRGSGMLAWLQGDQVRAATALEASMRQFRAAGDLVGTAEAVHDFGVATDIDEVEEKRRYLADSAALFRQAGGPYHRARALRAESLAAQFTGDWAAARRLAEEALLLFRAAGDLWWTADTSLAAGMHAFQLADFPAARGYVDEAIALFRSLGVTNNVAGSYGMLGRIALAEGNRDEAVSHFEESLALARREGLRRATALPLLMLGIIDATQGRYEPAVARLAESLGEFQAHEDYVGVAGCLETLGGVAFGRRDAIRAARLFGAAVIQRELHNADRDVQGKKMREPIVSAIRTALGEDAFATAYAEGRALSLAAAIDLALE